MPARSGAEYVESLKKHAPCVYLGGRRITDVTAEPIFQEPIRAIAVPLAGAVNDAARQTASALAEKLGALVVDSLDDSVGLIVVGSQPAAPPGRVVIGGDVRSELERARSSVLVLPAESPLLP